MEKSLKLFFLSAAALPAHPGHEHGWLTFPWHHLSLNEWFLAAMILLLFSGFTAIFFKLRQD